MNPSKISCENALKEISESEVIAMSILAAGYLKPLEAIDYLRTLPNFSGAVVGVSKENHAKQTFTLLKESYSELAKIKPDYTLKWEKNWIEYDHEIFQYPDTIGPTFRTLIERG